MSWEKVGKTLAGVLLVVAIALGLHGWLGEESRLKAYLSYEYLTYPGQFSERISHANDALKFEPLNAEVQAIAQGALSREQTERMVALAQAPYRQLLAKPFEAGLVDHRTGLVISLHNTSQTPLSRVAIRLPVRGLVQVRDEEGQDRLPETAIDRIEIPSIAPGGAVKIWVYFDADYAQVRQGGISITHADGDAEILVWREVVGWQSFFAHYGLLFFSLLTLALIALLIVCARQRSRLRRRKL